VLELHSRVVEIGRIRWEGPNCIHHEDKERDEEEGLKG